MARQPYLWETIRDAIRLRISAGVYEPGSKIPSVRELSVEFEAAPMTVRQATSWLVDHDELDSRVGIGLFVPTTVHK
jgi:DNA-binding GntR family transcriptional regulator